MRRLVMFFGSIFLALLMAFIQVALATLGITSSVPINGIDLLQGVFFAFYLLLFIVMAWALIGPLPNKHLR